MTLIKDLPKITRNVCKYDPLNERFKLVERAFNLQFYAYYNARYNHMYDWVKETAFKKWGEDIKLIKLNVLMENKEERVCVIGTLLKHMSLQPSPLREVSEDHQLIPQPTLKRYTEDKDYIMLQDDCESVILQSVDGSIDVSKYVTGVMIAIIGKETDNGNRFLVEDYCYPAFPPQKPIVYASEPKYIAIASGLGFALKMSPSLLSAQSMFLDFVTGTLGEANSKYVSNVVKVIIAGNCLGKNARDQEKELYKEELENQPEWSQQERSYTLETIKKVDDYLAQLGTSVEVDYMPGPLDPTCSTLPQQPIHPCVLPKSAMVSTIRCVTNPYCASFDDITFLGTSGRVVSTIKEFSLLEEPIDILGKTLEWRHMAPTAPDTLSSYPYPDRDPFVMDECPHVYFAGNQETFNTKLMERKEGGQKIRIIAVPDFEITKTIVLVNLQNLECEILAFG